MSNEAPADDEVTARVRAAVAGDFQPEHVNGFPMKPDEGSIDLESPSPCRYSIFDLSDSPWDLLMLAQGPIDARSSRPPVKEDDVDHDRIHESTEKQKPAKDLEKKKDKKKNLESQALEKRRAKSRQKGESAEDSPDEDDDNEGDDDSDDSEGKVACLDRILKGPPQADVDAPRMGAPKRSSGGPHDGQQKESPPRRSCANTPPVPTQGRSVSQPQPPPASRVGHRVKTMATGPLTCGCAAVAASSQGEGSRGSSSPGARQTRDVEPRPAPAQEKPGVSTWGGSRPVGRGAGRRVVLPVG